MEDGKYRRVPVEIKKGRPMPVEGTTAYYLRFSEDGYRKVEPVGAKLDTAFIAYQNRELNRARLQMSLPPIHGSAALLRDFKNNAANPVLVSDAVSKYLADLEVSVKIGEKSKRTWSGYKSAVEDFRDRCGVKFMNEITGEVLKKYKLWLFESIQKRGRGKTSNTVATRFRFLSAFFMRRGIRMYKTKSPSSDDKGLMDWSDFPRDMKKEYVNKYSEDEVNAMLSVADIDEADLIQTFLRTGCRDEEIVYLHWTDLDFKRHQIVISEKPKYGWRPKDREVRTIPLEDGVLLKRLVARKRRQSRVSHLVFPNTNGKPDQHLIRRLRKVAEKAEAKGFTFEGDVTLHRFRPTYASIMISHCDLQTVSLLLGHSHIQTTAAYLAADQTKARVGTRTAFKARDRQ
jgi:integrase